MSEGEIAVGSLVRLRGRDWIVLPSQDPKLVLNLKPVTGLDDERTGAFLPLEKADIEPAKFPPPSPDSIGDPGASRVVFDAARLLLRSSAAPFRSAGRLSFSPRPYQFVPLIMALRLNPVRMLIADDVGVGKTIEAGMIARELLDRGIVRRLLVLCPAHLCDQVWEPELREKFGINSAVIVPSNYARLARNLPRNDLSVYAHYPHLVASIDFVKSGSHRHVLLQNAPDLVIVDEAHLATRPRGAAADRVQQQRYELLRALADDPKRHLVLVTATPHSGIEESFRSLLGLLDRSFDSDPASPLNRGRLVPHLVQRRRRDVEKWLGGDTPFPERVASERSYSLASPYRKLFDGVLKYCQETVEQSDSLRAQQQRVRHWAAIALLRCVLSSPAMAVTVLSKREENTRHGGAQYLSEAEEDNYEQQVLDGMVGDNPVDYAPTAALEASAALLAPDERRAELRRLNDFRLQAEAIIASDADRKLEECARVVAELLRDGCSPIIFCRFIDTALYVAEKLDQRLATQFPDLRVPPPVTGRDGEELRRKRIDDLSKQPRRVLVATDCLSEGINLQEHFDSVVHYDLPWNPNRLEQREGRVDRFGQPRDKVRTVLLYGSDNPVDQVVLDVLIRKAREIRRALGVAVPVPANVEQVVQAVVDNVLLRRKGAVQMQLGLPAPSVSRLHAAWDKAVASEKEERTYFAQRAIKPDEVAGEIEATDRVLGDANAVRRFVTDVAQRFNGYLRPTRKPDVFSFHPGDLKSRLAHLDSIEFPANVVFDRRIDPDAVYLGRTSPIVEEACHAVIARAFGNRADGNFARAGAQFSAAVTRRTALVLLRIRYLLREEVEEFAEEVLMAAFEQHAGQLEWLMPLRARAASLAESAPAGGNMPIAERSAHVRWALGLISDPKAFAAILDERRSELQAAHNRLRGMLKLKPFEITVHPPDILGCYVYVPVGGAAR
jgi:superfamily II DNA or RNA helicase